MDSIGRAKESALRPFLVSRDLGIWLRRVLPGAGVSYSEHVNDGGARRQENGIVICRQYLRRSPVILPEHMLDLSGIQRAILTSFRAREYWEIRKFTGKTGHGGHRYQVSFPLRASIESTT